LLEGWVSGVADDEGTEHSSDTGSGSGNTNGGSTGTNELSSGVDISSDWGGSDVSSKAHSESWGSDKLSGGHFKCFFVDKIGKGIDPLNNRIIYENLKVFLATELLAIKELKRSICLISNEI